MLSVEVRDGLEVKGEGGVGAACNEMGVPVG